MAPSFPDAGQFSGSSPACSAERVLKNIRNEETCHVAKHTVHGRSRRASCLDDRCNGRVSTSPETGKQHARSAAHFVPQHRRRPVAHSVLPQVSVFREQGYVYVPRKGIVDEACNLPTSACPNEMRDVQ